MRPGEHVLVISHTFPPYRGIGGRRWAKFAKALARKGHVVHVIHSAGAHDLEGSLWEADIKHKNIITHPLPQRYPSVLFKRPLTSLWEKFLYRAWIRLMPVLAKGNWLDKSVFWEKQLLRKSRELIDAHTIRNVIVTGAPFRLMAHVVKLKKERPGLHFVADLRDPWSWGHVYGHGKLGASREAHERALEAEVMAYVDRAIAPAPAMIERLKAAYPAAAARVIHMPHAIDPEEMGTPAPRSDDGIFRMIYAGSLYGAEEAEAYFDALLAAFQRTREERPDAFSRCVFDLYITGHNTRAYEAKVEAAGLSERIRFHVARPAKEIFPLIAAADLVVIFIPSINKDFLGTKFTEIFHLRRPVLHVGVDGLVGSTITANKLGASLRVEELIAELPRLISRERVIEIDPGYDLSAHMLENITDRLVREVLA